MYYSARRQAPHLRDAFATETDPVLRRSSTCLQYRDRCAGGGALFGGHSMKRIHYPSRFRAANGFSIRVVLSLCVVLFAACARRTEGSSDESAGHGTSPSGAGGMLAAGASEAGAGMSGVAGAVAGSAAISGSGAAGNAGKSAVAGASGATHAAAGAAGAAGRTGAAGQAGSSGAAGSMQPPPGKKFAGNITTSGQVRSDFAMYWDQITPENEGKWGSVEATHNQMNWAGLDRVHDYAKSHGIAFKQHNFVWGSQQPAWLSGMTAAEQKGEVEEWIRLFCERYPDVALIDVVNEPPPHTMPSYADALGGAGSSGYDWIVQAFRWAHQYCPNAILILNDYNTIEYANDNTHFIDIVTRIKQAGAPIDAIGAQAHDAYKLSNTVVQGFLDKLAGTGLPIYITEYDINLASDTDQQQVMQTQFPLFWNDAHIAGVTLWGYVVGATWKTDTGLVTSAGMQRPAMAWLMKFLGR
jgi:endo-1,4-beta-xylanase